MKNVIIVLLIAAVGMGAYYYFNKKQNIHPVNSRELILGKWKVDSLRLPMDDTISYLERSGISLHNYYRFDSSGNVIKQQNDTSKVDTSFYKWAGNDKLVWTQIKNDTATKPLQIITLNKTDLILESPDHGKIILKKIE